MNTQRDRRVAFARLLGSAVGSQALLSAASFAVGLILIRRTPDAQYGAYVLALGAVLLAASLQNAFINPLLSNRFSRLDQPGRANLIGGIQREQRRLLAIAATVTVGGVASLWHFDLLDGRSGPLVLATGAAAIAVMHREFVRLVLLAHRRPQDVLRCDLLHVALMVAGAALATLTPMPALAAIVSLAVAALASGQLLSRALFRHEAWNPRAPARALHEMALLAAWSTVGAAIHWTFSQGSLYVVASRLDVASVAAIAATRLLLMPMNLLSTGIGSLMLPLASGWLHEHGATVLLRRLLGFALALGAATACYLALLWWAREWLFASVLHKAFADRDALLLMWGLIFLVMVVRDQLVYLLAAEGRFRALTLLTLASATVSLAASWAAMARFGVVGALAGMLAGEALSLLGIVWLSWRRPPHAVLAPA